MTTLALIPARGGSKSLPRKNICLFRGRPLIVHSIECAQQSRLVDRIIVSTDCPEIADVAREAGAEVPFLRPAELAQDDTLDLPVFHHCLDWLEEHEGVVPAIIVQLRPTSPLRSPQMVDEAIAILQSDPEADSVRAICHPTQNPFKMWRVDEGGYLTPLVPLDLPEPYNQPRQALPEVFWQNGYVDVMRAATLREQNSMTGRRIRPLFVADNATVDIDSQLTLRFGEMLHEEREQQRDQTASKEGRP